MRGDLTAHRGQITKTAQAPRACTFCDKNFLPNKFVQNDTPDRASTGALQKSGLAQSAKDCQTLPNLGIFQ
ncbi:hypothetical protein H5R16_002101 [Salmonella enterica]|uniref:hypothetical protein n=1 Tax=Salmonella enterica TaxID=28901 RepID=UPI0015C4440B|nr:hypothetical protein [Salmonella enterica]EEL8923957.1 hypothetical protein [Salmonella enterica]EFB0005569.1 hypothetical protein [Salmonella enterica]EGA4542192.1 hypothetical protein [Salmonella enterica]EGS4577010.1 hypothetical protein [Salmonella enterica]EHE1549859.1 hypothetical protein [Salmonella enterica]